MLISGLRQIDCFRRSLTDFPANLGSAQQNIDGAVNLIDADCVSKDNFLALLVMLIMIKIYQKLIHSNGIVIEFSCYRSIINYC